MKKVLSLLILLGLLMGPGPVVAKSTPGGTPVVKEAPRGIRNSNPGNLRARDDKSWRHWKGATGVDDKGYLTFGRDQDGLRALVLNLQSYHRKYGINTVDGIIRRWSNDVPEDGKLSYIKFICHRLGVKPKTQLNMEDEAVLITIARSIVHFENGQDPYSDRTYKKVLSKLNGGKR